MHVEKERCDLCDKTMDYSGELYPWRDTEDNKKYWICEECLEECLKEQSK